MNNPSSVLYGWLVLIAAGGGAYYFAKKDINARWREFAANNKRPTEKLDWQERVRREEERMKAETPSKEETTRVHGNNDHGVVESANRTST
ncbi:hypothetical protein BDF22DRAFT_676326 [Syncephalis plumigaleata]|nr:hypothetical protein BDF22DRAFT_676326 [Syncephalis plumigaleata]